MFSECIFMRQPLDLEVIQYIASVIRDFGPEMKKLFFGMHARIADNKIR